MKVAFITCVDDENEYAECLYYLERLEAPEGFEKDIIEIRNATSMTAGYNEGMDATDADYKIYLHQDAFIINKSFIEDIHRAFSTHPEIGIMGVVGSRSLRNDGRIIAGYDEGKLYHNLKPQHLTAYSGKEDECIRRQDSCIQSYVQGLDGLILMTQYDVRWREDIFDGWDFYDISQCLEFERKGYRAAIPCQSVPWIFHDCANSRLDSYNRYRGIFLKEYFPDNKHPDNKNTEDQRNAVEAAKRNSALMMAELMNGGRRSELYSFFEDENNRGYVHLIEIELAVRIDRAERMTGTEPSVWCDGDGYEEAVLRLRRLKFFLKRIQYNADETGEAKRGVSDYSDIAIQMIRGAYT